MVPPTKSAEHQRKSVPAAILAVASKHVPSNRNFTAAIFTRSHVEGSGKRATQRALFGAWLQKLTVAFKASCSLLGNLFLLFSFLFLFKSCEKNCIFAHNDFCIAPTGHGGMWSACAQPTSRGSYGDEAIHNLPSGNLSSWP